MVGDVREEISVLSSWMGTRSVIAAPPPTATRTLNAILPLERSTRNGDPELNPMASPMIGPMSGATHLAGISMEHQGDEPCSRSVTAEESQQAIGHAVRRTVHGLESHIA